ncbi:MAG TPA: hypothetical protein VKS22_17075 [Candidatus Binataceae bacterium]|nr:hypothetical protein [Candidatus Binataceae bacterium]
MQREKLVNLIKEDEYDSKRWNTYGGSGDNDGGSAALTINGFGPSWIVATPLLQFVNNHSGESFAFAGVSGWIRATPDGARSLNMLKMLCGILDRGGQRNGDRTL